MKTYTVGTTGIKACGENVNLVESSLCETGIQRNLEAHMIALTSTEEKQEETSEE